MQLTKDLVEPMNIGLLCAFQVLGVEKQRHLQNIIPSQCGVRVLMLYYFHVELLTGLSLPLENK